MSCRLRRSRDRMVGLSIVLEVGLLFALPNTQLQRRLAKEGRLGAGFEVAPGDAGDQFELVAAPAGATVDSATGAFQWAVPADADGWYER